MRASERTSDQPLKCLINAASEVNPAGESLKERPSPTVPLVCTSLVDNPFARSLSFLLCSREMDPRPSHFSRNCTSLTAQLPATTKPSWLWNKRLVCVLSFSHQQQAGRLPPPVGTQVHTQDAQHLHMMGIRFPRHGAAMSGLTHDEEDTDRRYCSK